MCYLESWTALDSIPVSKTCRVMKLLDMRAFELKSAVHDVFDHVWSSLVQINASAGQVAMFDSREGERVFGCQGLLVLTNVV
jgi:centromere/kinetochore protein ZW10